MASHPPIPRTVYHSLCTSTPSCAMPLPTRLLPSPLLLCTTTASPFCSGTVQASYLGACTAACTPSLTSLWVLLLVRLSVLSKESTANTLNTLSAMQHGSSLFA